MYRSPWLDQEGIIISGDNSNDVTFFLSQMPECAADTHVPHRQCSMFRSSRQRLYPFRNLLETSRHVTVEADSSPLPSLLYNDGTRERH